MMPRSIQARSRAGCASSSRPIVPARRGTSEPVSSLRRCSPCCRRGPRHRRAVGDHRAGRAVAGPARRIAMAVGLARILRSGAEIPEYYWRTLVNYYAARHAGLESYQRSCNKGDSDGLQSERCGRRRQGHRDQRRREGLRHRRTRQRHHPRRHRRRRQRHRPELDRHRARTRSTGRKRCSPAGTKSTTTTSIVVRPRRPR